MQIQIIELTALLIVSIFGIWKFFKFGAILDATSKEIESLHSIAKSSQELANRNLDIIQSQSRTLDAVAQGNQDVSGAIKTVTETAFLVRDEVQKRYAADIKAMMETYNTLTGLIERDLNNIQTRTEAEEDRLLARKSLEAALQVFDKMSRITLGQADVHEGIYVAGRFEHYVMLNLYADSLFSTERVLIRLRHPEKSGDTIAGELGSKSKGGMPEEVANCETRDSDVFGWLEERHLYAAIRAKLSLAKHISDAQVDLTSREDRRYRLLTEAAQLIQRYKNEFTDLEFLKRIRRAKRIQEPNWRLFQDDLYPFEYWDRQDQDYEIAIDWEWRRCNAYFNYLKGEYAWSQKEYDQALKSYRLARHWDPSNEYCQEGNERSESKDVKKVVLAERLRFFLADYNYVIVLEHNFFQRGGEDKEMYDELVSSIKELNRAQQSCPALPDTTKLMILYAAYEYSLPSSRDEKSCEGDPGIYDRFAECYNNSALSTKESTKVLNVVMQGHKESFRIIESGYDFDSNEIEEAMVRLNRLRRSVDPARADGRESLWEGDKEWGDFEEGTTENSHYLDAEYHLLLLVRNVAKSRKSGTKQSWSGEFIDAALQRIKQMKSQHATMYPEGFPYSIYFRIENDLERTLEAPRQESKSDRLKKNSDRRGQGKGK